MSRPRSLLLAALLTAELVGAVPLGPLEPAERALWPLLNAAGIAVYFQPMTFDMPALIDRESGTALYTRAVVVVYRSGRGDELVPWSELKLYSWRIPAMRFIEAKAAGADGGDVAGALCRELSRLRGPGAAFMLKSDVGARTAASTGLNAWQACP